VYVADKSNFTIRQITPTGRVSAFAGFPGIPGDADGPGRYARFNDPHGVAVDSAGNIYVADTGNNAIRKINSFGMVKTLAGMAGRAGDADGIGNKALFSNVQSVAAGDGGNIYVLDGDIIRKITPGGVVTTLLHFSLQPSAFSLSFHPTSMAVDGMGNLYLVEGMNNVIWQVTPPSR
jgi:DNA-binding beta-propeller fold protein YncE